MRESLTQKINRKKKKKKTLIAAMCWGTPLPHPLIQQPTRREKNGSECGNVKCVKYVGGRVIKKTRKTAEMSNVSNMSVDVSMLKCLKLRKCQMCQMCQMLRGKPPFRPATCQRKKRLRMRKCQMCQMCR